MPDKFDGNRATLREKELVKPNQTKVFRCKVEYKEAGRHTVTLRMVKENGKAQGQKNPRADGWFGERMNVIVVVSE
jgi:hypothetical protein